MAPELAPGDVLRKVQGLAAEGWPAGLVVLGGNSAFHIDAAQRAILDAVVPAAAGEYALTVYGDEKVAVGTVVAASRSRGMFSAQRVVLVRDLAFLDGEPEPLFEYAANPAPDSHLIIRAPVLDRRRKLHKALAQQRMFFLFELPSDPLTAVPEIGPLALEQGLKLDREATALLAQVCDGELYRVSAELAKLAAWLGGAKRTVVADDIRETVAGEGAMSGWEMSEAILARDRRGALSAARKLVEAGEAPIKIVGGIAWRARVMLSSKAMLDAGRSPRQVVQANRAWHFEKQLLRGLERYDMDELLAFPAHLLAADRALKSRQIAPSAVLESLVDKMVGTD